MAMKYSHLLPGGFPELDCLVAPVYLGQGLVHAPLAGEGLEPHPAPVLLLHRPLAPVSARVVTLVVIIVIIIVIVVIITLLDCLKAPGL